MAIDFWVLFQKAKESPTLRRCSECGNGDKRERTVLSWQHVDAHRLMGVFFLPDQKCLDCKHSKITVAEETLSSTKQAVQEKQGVL